MQIILSRPHLWDYVVIFCHCTCCALSSNLTEVQRLVSGKNTPPHKVGKKAVVVEHCIMSMVDLPQGRTNQGVGLVTPQLMVVKVHDIRQMQLLEEAMIWINLA